MHAIVLDEFGPPENLHLEEVATPEPGPGQVRIAVEAAGVHLVDTALRSGRVEGPFPVPQLPATLGREVAGVVHAVGPGVDPALVGTRVVAHLGHASGGYAEFALTDDTALIPLPDGLSAQVAVAMVGTGRTALGILEVAAVTAEDVVLVTAAAGGLGTLLVQAARAAGAFVVGVAGGPDKVEAVAELGADLAVDYTAEDWPATIRRGLGGRSVTVALESVGGANGRAALDLVGRGGRLVTYGWSSGGAIPDLDEVAAAADVAVLNPLGPRMANRPGGLKALAEVAVAAAAAGELTPIVTTFALAEAAAAHTALLERRTTGKVVLLP
ncbi:zinc-binding dehydrogenase [Streptomyces sp. SID3343]|uniref:zinc-binding dehydrogenase n=1 Tax=Streptomyces sp. SID3343 TaxID=2690260 RepID=UPI0013704E35|nr:zinc-binding dehydrogenase [Streptomyces sp. SID3343]MYV98019.1 zinc-binding dehydrogenase [Streptomyces sp. SID3343]